VATRAAYADAIVGAGYPRPTNGDVNRVVSRHLRSFDSQFFPDADRVLALFFRCDEVLRGIAPGLALPEGVSMTPDSRTSLAMGIQKAMRDWRALPEPVRFATPDVTE
jgi:hypothetical protein